MIDWPTLLAGAAAAGATVWAAVQALVKPAVTTAVDESVKAAVKAIDWPRELARELEKVRGTERQEWRFKCYSELWGKLSPLAIYGGHRFNRQTAVELSGSLTAWYFSSAGGLLLTRQASEYYFALQDLLRTTSRLEAEWSADGSSMLYRHPERIMGELIPAVGRTTWDYFQAKKFDNWRDEAIPLAKAWREAVTTLAASWSELSEQQRFAVLQQVGSILRTSMVNDLESRLP